MVDLKGQPVTVEYEYYSLGFTVKSPTFINLTNLNGKKKKNHAITQVFANLINISKTDSD